MKMLSSYNKINKMVDNLNDKAKNIETNPWQQQSRTATTKKQDFVPNVYTKIKY